MSQISFVLKPTKHLYRFCITGMFVLVLVLVDDIIVGGIVGGIANVFCSSNLHIYDANCDEVEIINKPDVSVSSRCGNDA